MERLYRFSINRNVSQTHNLSIYLQIPSSMVNVNHLSFYCHQFFFVVFHFHDLRQMENVKNIFVTLFDTLVPYSVCLRVYHRKFFASQRPILREFFPVYSCGILNLRSEFLEISKSIYVSSFKSPSIFDNDGWYKFTNPFASKLEASS